MKFIVMCAVLFLSGSAAFAASPGGVLGIWKITGGDSQLELFRCGEKICGKIIWLKSPKYIDSKYGPVGTIKVDRKNPNPALRKRSIIGLQVMQGFTATGDNRWGSGTCYNPENGKSYKSNMHLESSGKLELRGYIGFSFIGRTITLTR
jgi:uncharacterized protein (DUF2147 family)